MKQTPKFLYWRGCSLWSRMPLPGYPPRYALKIFSSGSTQDKKACELLGENMVAKLRTKAIEGTLFDKTEKKEAPYRPTVNQVADRYWECHLQYKKSRSGKNGLSRVRKAFGRDDSGRERFWDEVSKSEAEVWLQEMVKKEHLAVNSANTFFNPLHAMYEYAVCESDPKFKLPYSPVAKVKKLPGGKVRTFLLTQKRFERNYAWLQVHFPRFAPLYLAIWETGRRPMELSSYTWEIVQDIEVDGVIVHVFMISPDITKPDRSDLVPISERLWTAMNQQGWRNGFVFRNDCGSQWVDWSHQMNKLKEVYPDCGWFRDGRRGFATYQVETLKKPREHVRAITGHKSDKMFDRYCIGNLENKLRVTNPELFKKRGDEGTPQAQFGTEG